MAKTLTPLDTFLAPLTRLAAKHPDLEGEVIWAAAEGWAPQEETAELLDAEEIAFYAEGLLLEGFHMQYQVLAETTAPKDPVHVRLFFWEGQLRQPPLPEAGLCVLAQATWAG